MLRIKVNATPERLIKDGLPGNQGQGWTGAKPAAASLGQSGRSGPRLRDRGRAVSKNLKGAGSDVGSTGSQEPLRPLLSRRHGGPRRVHRSSAKRGAGGPFRAGRAGAWP